MKLKTAIKLFHQNVQNSLKNGKPFEFIRCNRKVCPFECIYGIKWDNLKFEDNKLTVANGYIFKLSQEQENKLNDDMYELHFKTIRHD